MSASEPKGVTGVSAPSGYVQQREQNPSLRWPFDVGTAVEPGAYERMARTDPTVASCVMAVVLPIAQAEWEICEPEEPVKLKDQNADPEDAAEGAEPPGDADPEDLAEPPEPAADLVKDPAARAPSGAENLPGQSPTATPEPKPEAVDPITAFVRQAFLEHMRPGLPKAVADIVRSATGNGHHVVEPLFRLVDNGPFAGKVTLRTLAPRPAWTIERFNLDDAGELVSITQAAPKPNGMWERAELTADEILLFTYDQQGGDPRGQSMLRPIFLVQKVKEFLIKLIGVRNEREALGMPVVEEPEGGLSQPERSRLDRTLKGWRAHEEGFLRVPAGVKVTFPKGEAGSADAIRADLDALDVQISRAFLQQFQHLGTSETGSRSVGEVHADLFYLALTSIAELVVDQLNLLIERLVDLNFGPQERYPYFDAPKIRPEDVAKALQPIADAVKNQLISADETVEKAAREMLGLPPAKPKALPPAMQAVADAAKAGQIAPPVPPPPAAPGHQAAAAITKAAQAAAMSEHGTSAATFEKGDRVKVRAGKAHDDMTANATGTVVEVSGPALGIKFDGMAKVHRWYVAEELTEAGASSQSTMAMHAHRQGELFLGSFMPRRMLSPAEKLVAFGEIAARLDRAGAELQQRVGNAIRGNRDELVAWVRPLARRIVAGDREALDQLARKDLPKAVRAAIVNAVRGYANELHRFGRAQAERERQLAPAVAKRAAREAADALRQDIPAAPAEAAPGVALDDKAAPPTATEAAIYGDRIADELLRVLRLATTRAAAASATLPQVLDDVEQELDASAEAMSVVRDAAMATSVKAFAGGREEVFGENADEISSVAYSALMDSNTCSVCQAADGREAGSLEAADADLPPTPNPECLGGEERCRCIWVVSYR